MSVLIGIVIIGLFIWIMYARYGRVLARKRYSTRQDSVPDLGTFAGPRKTTEPPNDGQNRPK